MAKPTVPEKPARTHKNARNDLTAEYVRSILDYEPETGLLRWKVQRPSHRGKVQPGKVAGTSRGGTRIKVGIDGHEYMAHRLIWLIVTGRWPEYEIDHKNLNGTDNRWDNLRPATSGQNQSNRPLRSHNRSGTTGVCFANRERRWLVTINKKYVGTFRTKEEAIAARKEAEKQIHKEFTHQNLP